VRQADIRATNAFGPPPEGDCPCGSHRQARHCHRSVDDSWIAEPPPALLAGPRTGHANAGCYARSSNDCSEDLTFEHYITDDLLESISANGKVVAVKGAAWQAPGDNHKTIGVNSLGARMLCGRHNVALSPLDKMAAEFFRHFRADQLEVMCFQGNEFQRDFTLVSGSYLELWMLKVVWGAIEAKAMEVGGSPAYRFRLGVTTSQLTEILWYGADWPTNWGMYVLHNQHPELPATQNSVRLRPAAVQSEVLGVYLQIAGFEFLISFEPPPLNRIYRPCGLTFQRNGFPKLSWKMFAFAWPELGHHIINVISAVPPNVNFTVPPNANAASLANQPLPGSLHVTSGQTQETPWSGQAP
jgi:hypothetical protein